MDLKDLKCLVAVAESGSFIRAAALQHMSQPSVSSRMRTLEDRLGVVLFQRTNKGIQITEEGQELLQHANIIMRQLENAEADMNSFRQSPVGLVRLGLPTSLTASFATPILERCMEEIPGVKLRIVESMSGYIIQWLQGNILDIGITFGASAPPDISITSLAREDLLLVGKNEESLNCYKNSSGDIQFSALSKINLILPGPEHGLRALIEKQANKQAVKINVVIEIDAFGEIQRLVSKGYGYTIMSSAAFNDGSCRDLVACRVANPAISRVMNISFPTARIRSRASREVARIIEESVWEKIQGETWLATADPLFMNKHR